MTTFASTTPASETDGVLYATGVQLPGTEADLGTPVVVPFQSAVLVEVALTISGSPGGEASATYVVLQTDLGDGNWLDVAWAITTSTSNGTLLFFLGGGAFTGCAIAQTRANGTAPGSTGSINCPLGGRIRLTGQCTFTGGISPKCLATARYKLLGPR